MSQQLGGSLVLDTPSIERRAEHYPEELREAYVWLATYVREDCARDIDILVDRAGKVGVQLDKTTWSRVIRGYWNRDCNGDTLAHPIVALPKLLRAIDVLRKDARIKEQSGKVPFVMTETAKTIFHYVDLKRAPDRVNKFGVVIGETGTQKTATFLEYCRRNNHGSCVWLDAPAKGSMYQFKSELAAKYGCHAHNSSARKEQRIAESVNDRKTIIIENVQRLHDDRVEGRQPIFEYVQNLQERTGCTIILSYTPWFDSRFSAGRAKGFFEQFVGRAGGEKTFLRLPAFPPREDVVAIAEAFGLRDAERHGEYLEKVAQEPGRIRVLFEGLQDAKVRAAAKKEALTIAHLKYVRDDED